MAGRNMATYRFNPRGVVDALDGGQVPPGGMAALTNLIFDEANPFTMQCRPAAIEETDFTGFTTPDFVSVAYVVGDICYGMVKSADVPGYDYPFAYNLATGAFVSVSGTKNNTTLPLSQSDSGTWTPPTMALVGPLLYVTHPGFVGGGSAFFGWFNTTNPAAPSWNAGNTGTNPLPGVPTNVAQFNNRAWLSVGENVHFTDALTTNISDSTHVLTIGDSIDITALAPQPLVTTVQGIIQSLVVFKPNAIAIITGDDADNNLAINIISSSVGCIAPRTIAATPRGLMFRAVDGIRAVTQEGTLQEPHPDLKVPFIFALTPSRASACYNNNTYRITVQNGNANGNPLEEYWLDFGQNGWTGPHTFIQDMAVPYGNTFVVFNSELAPSMWISDVMQTGNSTFVEDDEDMAFLYQASPMPDDGGMYENSCCLSVIDMQLPNNGDSYTLVASDVNRGVLATARINADPTGTIWGSFVWGNANWQATSYGMDRYNIPWNNAMVFSRLIVQATGKSSLGLKIGKMTIGYQPLKYVRIIS